MLSRQAASLSLRAGASECLDRLRARAVCVISPRDDSSTALWWQIATMCRYDNVRRRYRARRVLGQALLERRPADEQSSGGDLTENHRLRVQPYGARQPQIASASRARLSVAPRGSAVSPRSASG
jgi:hypothetical protein